MISVFRFKDGVTTRVEAKDIWDTPGKSLNDSEFWEQTFALYGLNSHTTVGSDMDSVRLLIGLKNLDSEANEPQYGVAVEWPHAGDDASTTLYLCDTHLDFTDLLMAKLLPFVHVMRTETDREEEAYERAVYEQWMTKAGYNVYERKAQARQKRFSKDYGFEQDDPTADALGRIADAVSQSDINIGKPIMDVADAIAANYPADPTPVDFEPITEKLDQIAEKVGVLADASGAEAEVEKLRETHEALAVKTEEAKKAAKSLRKAKRESEPKTPPEPRTDLVEIGGE